MGGKRGSELFIGLVGAVGTDLDKIHTTMANKLGEVGYKTKVIVISDLLRAVRGLVGEFDPSDNLERIRVLMDAGDRLRKDTKSNDALAKLAITAIRRFRVDNREDDARHVDDREDDVRHVDNQAYILKSLKHKDEAKKLRGVYGRNFWLASVYSSSDRRLDNLKRPGDPDSGESAQKALALISRDQHDEERPHGQDVRGVFPMGDVFFNADVDVSMPVGRFIRLVFGHKFETPTAEEYGMSHAFTSSLRSSSLSRQVGSSIATADGDVVSTGANEVPKFGGGCYAAGDEPDMREFQVGRDSNTVHRNEMFRDFLECLKSSEWLAGNAPEYEDMERKLRAEGKLRPKILGITEYGREVHAEMSALMDAARRTISVKGSTMYCTTFPCHVCAKHIIASGIVRVVYIEPYPKSFAKDLFFDSISVDAKCEADRVHFKPFEGIAPRRYADMFEVSGRKDGDGRVARWDAATAVPRYVEPGAYGRMERFEALGLARIMERLGLGIGG